MGILAGIYNNSVLNKYGPKIILSIFGCIYLIIVFCNHYFFRTWCFDYGLYNYAFYDYSHFRVSDCPLFFGDRMSLLQDHFSLTLMVFMPFYWLLGWLTGSYTLLYIQIFIILLGGWFVYKLIELKTSNRLLSILALIQYLIIYGRWTMMDADCNIAIMASSMVPLFIYYFEKKAYLLTALVFLFILISREDMALWTAFIGLFLLINHYKDREYRAASLLVIFLSIAWFILVFSVILPSLATEFKKYSLFNYSTLGKGPAEALKFMLLNPLKTIRLFFVNTTGKPLYDHVKFEFYYVYLICGGYLLFFRPKYLLLFIPLLAKKMLNDEPLRWSTDTFYSAEFVAILPIAVFLIISEVKAKIGQTILIILVSIGTVFITIYKLQYHKGSSVFWSESKHSFYKRSFYNSNFKIKEINHQINQIPDGAIISASGTITSHIAFRPKVYNFPKVLDAEYIAVFTDRDTYPLDQSEFDSTLTYYQNNGNWSTLVDNFPLLILKKEKKEGIPTPSKPKKILEYFCDAERLNSDKNAFLSSSGLLFYNANLQSNQYAHGGNYSIRLTKESPYGMTTVIENVTAGDRFEISVWRKAKNNNSEIIACSTLKNSYYNKNYLIESKDERGWELLKKKFVVAQNWPNPDLKIYLWNTGEDTVYFDDLHIVRESN
jgi:uncharacterized membrane protein